MTRFKSDNNIVGNDPVGVMLDLLAEVEELAVTVDMLDVSNLVCFERLVRHRQFVEEGFRQKLEDKRLENAVDGLALCLDHFAGRARMAGGAIVSPKLIDYVASRAHAEGELLKQQRKALEAKRGPKKS